MKELNSYLKNKYGIDDTGLSKYRLSWSAEVERRLGTFNDFHGDIFVRRVKEVREVPRYSWIIPPCWVLEFINYGEAPELGLRATYEMLFAFREDDGKRIQPNREFCNAIIWASRNPNSRPLLTEEMVEKRDRARIREILGEGSIADMLKYGDGVAFGGVKHYGESNGS